MGWNIIFHEDSVILKKGKALSLKLEVAIPAAQQLPYHGLNP